MATTVPSGVWHGFFSFYDDGDSRMPMELGFEIQDGEMHGKGTDVDGAFTLEGKVEEDGTLHWLATYGDDGSSTAYLGRFDSGEITGRWRVANDTSHGHFGLKPGPAESAIPKTDSSEKLRKELLGKGAQRCSIDLEALRFDGEIEMLDQLLGDPDYVSMLRTTEAAISVQARRSSGDSVRLNRTVLPHVFAALDRCEAMLGLDAEVVLSCANDGAINAFVSATPDDTIAITLTSGLINALDVDELAYVIGHELGHALLGHLRTRAMLGSDTPGIIVLRQLALARYQELSADRVGLLCCPDVHKVVRAEMMLHSGVTLRDKIGDGGSILKAAAEAARGTTAGDGGYSTHPYGPMRTLAIDWFGRSQTFAELRGNTGGEITEAELEKKVSALVEIMNPIALSEKLGDEDVAEFVALTSLAVAAAEDGINEDEAQALRNLGPGIAKHLERIEKLSFAQQQVRTVELAEKLAIALPLPRRHRLLEDLAIIAQADGNVADEEQEVIESVAMLLGVDACAGLDVIEELAGGLD